MLDHIAVKLEFPPTDDPLVAALQRLIRRVGSYTAVADRANVNDQSLYQVAMLKPHSVSGRPKSVGPNVRKKLDAAFPGWLETAAPAEVAPSTVIPLPSAPAWPHERFPHSYWESLTQAERAVVEEAMLEAWDRLMARREQLRTATGKTVRPAA